MSSSILLCNIFTMSSLINRCVSSRSLITNFLPKASVSSRCNKNCFIAGSLVKYNRRKFMTQFYKRGRGGCLSRTNKYKTCKYVKCCLKTSLCAEGGVTTGFVFTGSTNKWRGGTEATISCKLTIQPIHLCLRLPCPKLSM